MEKKLFLLAIPTILGLLVPAVAAQAPEPKYGGTLVIAIPYDPPTMTPNLSTGAPPQVCGWPVYSSLINLDKDFNPRPNLAERWEISPDKTKYTFYLRKDVKWHDGKPFTSADVVFTFENIVKKYTPFGLVQYKDLGLKVTAPDDYTVFSASTNRSHPLCSTSICLITEEQYCQNTSGKGPIFLRIHLI